MSCGSTSTRAIGCPSIARRFESADAAARTVSAGAPAASAPWAWPSPRARTIHSQRRSAAARVAESFTRQLRLAGVREGLDQVFERLLCGGLLPQLVAA